MTKTEISGIAPFFIVRNVPVALAFYRDRLGFDVTFQGPSEDDIFFGIVQRGAAMIILKDIGVDPVPNYTRDIKKGIARWDAYLHVPDPDALAAEFPSRNVEFFKPLKEAKMMVCGDLKSKTLMDISCSSVVLNNEQQSKLDTRTNKNINFRGSVYLYSVIQNIPSFEYDGCFFKPILILRSNCLSIRSNPISIFCKLQYHKKIESWF